jgi:hypothetical protein
MQFRLLPVFAGDKNDNRPDGPKVVSVPQENPTLAEEATFRSE